ncbi:hypothetical protein QVD17_41869 [Tagetes erecta]|uniref:Uncharacterized protein n=1 Tax=Tagetes erecta TaxID=13708 RepID=A0AAD8JRF3_TARER|nr:hypothetical protein QVD17_41869 [Tagetes erecta]
MADHLKDVAAESNIAKEQPSKVIYAHSLYTFYLKCDIFWKDEFEHELMHFKNQALELPANVNAETVNQNEIGTGRPVKRRSEESARKLTRCMHNI